MAGGAQSIAKACAGPHLPILQPPKTIQGILPGGVESSACPAMASAEKNSCTAEQIAPYSNKKVWWRCEKGHEWEASPSQMQGRGAEKACPYCNNRKVWVGNSLAYLAPELAADWHTDRNAPLTPEQIFPWSSKRVWWKCKKGTSGRQHQPNGTCAEMGARIAPATEPRQRTALRPYILKLPKSGMRRKMRR